MFLLFNRTTLHFNVTYLTDALYKHHLWFYKHQHDNWVPSKLFVKCQRWCFQWRFWFVPSVPEYTRSLYLESLHTTFEWFVSLWLFPEFGAELPPNNCTPTIILINHLYIHTYSQTPKLIVWTITSNRMVTMFVSKFPYFERFANLW